MSKTVSQVLCIVNPLLERDTRAREAREQLCADLNNGRRSVVDILNSLDDPISGRMKLKRMLEALPGFGEVKAAKMLDDLGISPTRRLQNLSSGERRQLLERLAGPGVAISRAPTETLDADGERSVLRTQTDIKDRTRSRDVFMCHASEDKESFVRPLAQALVDSGMAVWYDEYALRVGDSLRRAIDRGLAQCRFGIVVLSPFFFGKEWPQWELDGLVQQQISQGRKVILPVWHGVSRSDVERFSPPLADLVAVTSEIGVEQIVEELRQAMGASETP